MYLLSRILLKTLRVLHLSHVIISFCPSSTFFFLLLFRATLGAHGSSQARDQIGTAAAGLHHSRSKVGSELHHSSWQQWILKLLSEARECTSILMDTSRVHYC